MRKLGFVTCVALLGATGLLAQAAPADEAQAQLIPEAQSVDEEARTRLESQRLNPVEERTGVVGKVDFDGPMVTIDGLRYAFAPDATVNFLSGYGAPTLLTRGMAVHIVYESAPDTRQAGTILMLDEVGMDANLLH